LTVQNKLSTSLTFNTFNGYDTSCLIAYGTFSTVEATQNATIWCLMGDDCKISTSGVHGVCPPLAAACNDYVVYYVAQGEQYVCFDSMPDCDQRPYLDAEEEEDGVAVAKGGEAVPLQRGEGVRRRVLRLDETLGFPQVPTAAAQAPMKITDSRDAKEVAASVPPSSDRLRRRERN
jgi:hypothetical protein